MEKIDFHIQSSKKDGQVKVRYRLTDGRKVQMTHKTDVKCSRFDLNQLNPDGSTKARIRIYNEGLSNALKVEHKLMVDAYALMRDKGMDMTTAVFEQEILMLRNPQKAKRVETLNVVERFRKYADSALRARILGENRYKHIIVVSNKLERFLKINGMSGITASEFDVDHLIDFREFIFDEYIFVKQYPKLYEKVNNQNRPTAPLSMNTVTSQLKMLQTFFTELEDIEEIRKSPFRKLGKEHRKALMKTKYDEPFFLRKDELETIIGAKVCSSLKDTRDAFVVQCALGCRISDLVTMSLDSIAVTEDGIPYVHYIPKKTDDVQEDNVEIKTPIVRYAFDIIKRTGFSFPILNNIFGEYGFNAKIKALLQQCGIKRLVAQYNEQKKANDYTPLYKVASSKLARKTHVDIMNKVQIDLYAAGLHKVGSSAVNRYTFMELKDRFDLMNVAFEQEPYKVTNNLEIL